VFNCTRKRIPFELILILNQNELDGVVLVDSDYIKDRKVYGHVLAAFRYGREDLDVLGLTFRKDLYLASSQIFPPEPNNKRTPTRLQLKRIDAVMNHYDPNLKNEKHWTSPFHDC